MKKNSGYWYCPKCKEELDGCHVTYQELCEYCGTAVLSVSENISQGKLEEIIEAEAEGRIAPVKYPCEASKEAQELTNAKAEGRLVVLPCKAGDTIWKIKAVKL